MAKEKKESRERNPKALGVAGFTLGIVSIILFIFSPLIGALTSIVGFSLCLKQQNKLKTRAGKVGIILNAIGFVLSIATLIVTVLWFSPYMSQIYSQQLNGSSLAYP